MQSTDRKWFAGFVTGMAAYYQRELPPVLIEVWWRDLLPFPPQAIERAFDLHRSDARRGQFMPVKADMLRWLEGSPEERAAGAWAKVLTAIREVGRYEGVAFDDPIIHRCIVDLGGWTQLCGAGEELTWRAKDFARRYESYAARREVPDHPPALRGIANHQSTHLIGDRALAELVAHGRGKEISAIAFSGNSPLPSITQQGVKTP